MTLILRVLFLFLVLPGFSQESWTLYGKVIDAKTGAAIPFATVQLSGTTSGTISDFDGNFRLVSRVFSDSIEARSIGYISRKKPIQNESEQVVNFQLDEEVQTLSEVIVYAGENPAFPILRKVIANKKKNDKRSLDAYEYEAYTKIELSVDNMSEKFRNRGAIKKIRSVLDSIDQIAGEDGQPVLPVFISEAISQFYYRNDPVFRHEKILHTKITGVGLTDGTTTAQIIGSTLQEYNFYKNWLNIMTKDFASPIADGWKLYYEYDLVDSLEIGGEEVYRIDFFPRNDQDLTFLGTLWITKEDYALKRIDASVNKSVNLNYIEKIRIQQDLQRTSAGAWLPEKSRVVVDVSQLTKNTAGFIAKFYISARDVVVNNPMPIDFYQNPVSLSPDAQKDDEDFWEVTRHDSLTSTEANLYQMIDTLKKIPFVKAGMDGAKFGFTGYYKTGPVDVGPYTVFYGSNNIEGLRLGIGGRTNYQFSKKLTVGGYGAYGFDDERFKYQVYLDLVLDREKWTQLRFERQEELDQIWLLNQQIGTNSFLFTFSRFGELTLPFMIRKNRIILERQVLRGVNQKIELRQQSYHPQYDFRFSTSRQAVGEELSNFSISEINISTRWAKDELFVINDNERWSMGTIFWPAITLDYTYGIPDFLGSDLAYHKLQLRISQRQKLGTFGVSRIKIESGKIFGEVPYPLLFNLIGNETPFYASFTYNLMNFFEFSNDEYASLNYAHHFEGLLLNKIPLLRKLKWRALVTSNVVYGSISEKNRALVSYPVDGDGVEIIPFEEMTAKPYAEVGYGIENIFKVFRVDAFHRLTYLNNPGVDNFGVKFSMQLVF